MTDLAETLRDLVRQLVWEELAAIDTQPRPPRLLSIQEAADRLGLARSNFYRLVADGSLTTVKIGGRRLVSEAALAEFIDRAEDAAAAEARARR